MNVLASVSAVSVRPVAAKHTAARMPTAGRVVAGRRMAPAARCAPLENAEVSRDGAPTGSGDSFQRHDPGDASPYYFPSTLTHPLGRLRITSHAGPPVQLCVGWVGGFAVCPSTVHTRATRVGPAGGCGRSRGADRVAHALSLSRTETCMVAGRASRGVHGPSLYAHRGAHAAPGALIRLSGMSKRTTTSHPTATTIHLCHPTVHHHRHVGEGSLRPVG